MFFRVFRHLLPNARAWRLVVNKRLRSFFEGLAGSGTLVKSFLDGVYLDLLPQHTRELSAWERQFALPDTGLNEQARRDRLDAAWKAVGGQDPRYIQDTLRARGFDVYVHEWWQPGTEPAVGVAGCATPRNPLLWIRREFDSRTFSVQCGEDVAQAGEPEALCGNSFTPRGYPLVNKVVETVPDVRPLCGVDIAECGEPVALCGNFVGYKQARKTYIVPDDPAKWPYFLYIGGEDFGGIAQVPQSRREEFEDLCLKLCPAQQWLGIIVEYV